MTSRRQPASALSVFQLYVNWPEAALNVSCDVETATDSSSESCVPLAQLVRRIFEIEVTAVSAPTTTPFASSTST